MPHKKQKSNPTSSEESNKMSKEIPSQDSPSDEIEWDIEDLKQAYIDAAEQSWDKFSGG